MIFISALIVFGSTVLIAFADDPPVEDSVTITASSATVAKKKTIQMKADIVTAKEGSYTVTWSSSNSAVATVDQSGVVTGVSIGQATITAKVEALGVSDQFLVYGVKNSNFVFDMLEKKQRLGYRYSYSDDFYYTDDKDCWQSAFGFFNLYDLVAPYILMEYDYARVYFTYDNRDWMIQLWKGQYGLLFYGSEVGVYNKEHSDKEVTAFTHFKCPEDKNDWLNMEMALYRDEKDNGKYVYQFSRKYDTYWWCTGFKSGYLNDVEPANELKMTTKITMKDEEMKELFVKGLEDCKFKQVDSIDKLVSDCFFVDGLDVHIIWQNLSEAENTMAIKTTIGVLASAGFIGFFLMILMVILALFAMGGLGFLVFLII